MHTVCIHEASHVKCITCTVSLFEWEKEEKKSIYYSGSFQVILAAQKIFTFNMHTTVVLPGVHDVLTVL